MDYHFLATFRTTQLNWLIAIDAHNKIASLWISPYIAHMNVTLHEGALLIQAA